MNFFFDPDSILSLKDYGIEIPLSDQKIQNICTFLKSKNQKISGGFQSISLTKNDLEAVHSSQFVSKLFGSETQKQQIAAETFELINQDGSFNRYNPKAAIKPLEELVEKVLTQSKGTILTVNEALLSGEAFHLGGGYHHAMSFGGRGFCMLNDIVIAARWAQRNLGIKKIWIIDLDAHKGDGTAELTQHDSTIRTLSIHMKEGWPLDSQKYDESGNLNPWFIESDIEIGLGIGAESNYNELLINGLNDLEKLDEKLPDLAIVVQGSDPYEKDGLPSSELLKLSKEAMLERDRIVYHFLKSRTIPQAYVMAGGYGDFASEPYIEFFDWLLSK